MGTSLRPELDAPQSPDAQEQRLAGRPFSSWEVIPAAVVITVFLVIAWRALSSAPTYDIGLAYQGGEVASRTGHPENLATWISTPLLGAVMALVTRVASEGAAAWALTMLNLLIVAFCYGFIWYELRFRLGMARLLWWATLFAAVLYAPWVSSLWWKQLNLVALALAGAGFLALRSSRPRLGALLIAVSILIKPLAILLPVAMFLRRDTRRAAAMVVAFGLGLVASAQAYLALRAGELSALNPMPAIENFSHKSEPSNIWVCHPENFSPQSMLCRIIGSESFGYQRIAVVLGVLLLAGLANLALRDFAGSSWEVFAFACLLSPMISPLAWSHYQIMLLPMFILLALSFGSERAPWILCIGLVGSFVLAELIWRPAISLPGAALSLLGDTAETQQTGFRVMGVSMFAQYALYVVALCWFLIRGSPLAKRAELPARLATYATQMRGKTPRHH